MSEKFEILLKYVKDISTETPDAETHLFVKDNLLSYVVDININSKALKNKLIEVNTKFEFKDGKVNNKKSYFEILFATVIKIDENIKSKKELEKIVLADVQNKIYPDIEERFLKLLEVSGYPNIKIRKKVNFDKLYEERKN